MGYIGIGILVALAIARAIRAGAEATADRPPMTVAELRDAGDG